MITAKSNWPGRRGCYWIFLTGADGVPRQHQLPSSQQSARTDQDNAPNHQRPAYSPALAWNHDRRSKPPSHAPVPQVDWLAVHQRATADDALDAWCSALLDRAVADATLTKRPVKPQFAHAASAALPYQLDRDVGVCSDCYARRFAQEWTRDPDGTVRSPSLWLRLIAYT